MLSYTLLLLYVGGVLGLLPIDDCKIVFLLQSVQWCCVHVFYYAVFMSSIVNRLLFSHHFVIFVVSGLCDCKLSLYCLVSKCSYLLLYIPKQIVDNTIRLGIPIVVIQINFLKILMHSFCGALIQKAEYAI